MISLVIVGATLMEFLYFNSLSETQMEKKKFFSTPHSSPSRFGHVKFQFAFTCSFHFSYE